MNCVRNPSLVITYSLYGGGSSEERRSLRAKALEIHLSAAPNEPFLKGSQCFVRTAVSAQFSLVDQPT